MIQSLLFFVIAGLCEIGGGYLFWLWLREGKSIWLAIIGAIVLAIYGVVPTLQPVNFGRAYAAYGGVFIVLSFPLAQAFLLGQDESASSQNTLTPELSTSAFGAITGTATGLKKGMFIGNLVGGTTGLLLGAVPIALPRVGQLMLSSAIAFILLSGGICPAAGGLIGASIGLGLTSEQAKAYSRQIAKGSFLLVVEGTARDIYRAQLILKKFLV